MPAAAANAVAIALRVDETDAVAKLGKFSQALGTLSGGASGPQGVARLASAFGELAQAARDAALHAAELSRGADQIGTSVGRLDRFTRSARALAGVPFDRSIDALKTFQEHLGDAAFEPDSQIAGLFDRIDVAVRRSDGTVRDTLQVWDDFVDAVGKADRATRNSLTAEFGDIVRDIAIPMSRNTKAVDDYQARLRVLAGINEELAEDAAAANLQFELLDATLGALGTNLGNFAAKYLGVAAEFLTGVAGGVKEGLFGSAVVFDVEFETLEEAQAYLDGIKAIRQSIQESIDEIEDSEVGHGGFGTQKARQLERFRYLDDLAQARQASVEAHIKKRETGDAGTRDNQFVAELTRQFNLATINAKALGDEIERLRADPDSDPALIRHLELQRQSLLQQRSTKDVETERLRLQLQLVGLSAEEAQLATLRHRRAAATDDEERARLTTQIDLTEQLQAETAAQQERVAIETAIESLTLQIERQHYGIREALLEELGITRQMLQDNTALAALFEDILATRQQQAEKAREEALYGDVNRQLDVERARATGLDLRLHRHLVELQRQGVKYGEEELDNLEAKLEELDKLTFANDLRDDLRDAVGGGLRDGLREFAEGGDIGDVFDEIGRRLSSLLLDLAIGGFGQGGSGGTGLLGWLGGLFSGQRERGGPVDAGRLYLVGERGPELFMPRVAGNVLASVGSGPAVTQQITVQGAVRSDADVAAIAQRVSAQAAASVLETIRNGRAVVA